MKLSYIKPILLILLLLNAGQVICAEDTAAYKKKLEDLRQYIDNIEKDLDKDKSKRGRIQTLLKTLEKKIANISKELNYTRFLVKKRKKKIKSLKIELKELESTLSAQKEVLAMQIRAAFGLGSNETVKLLLNQENPSELGRAFVYYEYLNRARTREITTFKQLLDKKITLKSDLEANASKLQALENEQKQQKKHFLVNRQKRTELLAQLNTRIDSTESTLDKLLEHRRSMENLLISLGEILADIPEEPSGKKPFNALKGQLPWPLAGRITNHFGTRKKQSDLKWNGVVLSAKYGKTVHAINYGRVVFANWLQGYGFITIIDHGTGYMSLYGFNETLLKEPGDWVEAGEPIATVGDSGGQSKSGLYFEIRQQGKPVNPRKWCSIKHTHFAAR